jgi:hypothetical protein
MAGLPAQRQHRPGDQGAGTTMTRTAVTLDCHGSVTTDQ